MLTKEEVITKINGDKPISIIRAGDGEKIILDAMDSVANMERASKAVFHRQTGYYPTVEQLKEVRKNLIVAYTNADVIGIPNHRQKTSEEWKGVVPTLDRIVPNHATTFCDIDVAYHMLMDGYDQILQGRRVLNYISCRDLDAGFQNKWGIKITNQYLIAPEAKWVSGYEGDVHYPTQFNRIPRWMDVLSERHPGSLLLVGAGVIGKIYCNWWRDRGGIAFDFGGVADIFAGKITRGPEKGIDKEDPDTKYKL